MDEQHDSGCDMSSGESCSTETGCAVTLTGEQMTAHLALQEAAKALKDAQAKVTEAQTVFRGALERWCRASEG